VEFTAWVSPKRESFDLSSESHRPSHNYHDTPEMFTQTGAVIFVASLIDRPIISPSIFTFDLGCWHNLARFPVRSLPETLARWHL
jgi:hypothetical protein